MKTPNLAMPYTREEGPTHLRECASNSIGDCLLSGDRRKFNQSLLSQYLDGTIDKRIVVLSGIPQGRRIGDKRIKGKSQIEKYGNYEQRINYVFKRKNAWSKPG